MPLKFWRRHFLWMEFFLAIAAAAATAYWIVKKGGFVVVNSTLDGNRSSVYGTLASIFGSLLGFVITAASIVIGFSSSDRLTVVRESAQYPTLWKVFTASIRALAFATIVSLTALIIDRDKRPIESALCVAIFASLLATFRLLRCLWVFENIIALLTLRRNG